jgi:hypothetical protein
MIGRQAGDQSQLFSSFNRDERIPAGISGAGSIRLQRACWLTLARS